MSFYLFSDEDDGAALTPAEQRASERLVASAWGNVRPAERPRSYLAWDGSEYRLLVEECPPSPALLEAVRRNIAARERNARALRLLAFWGPVAVVVLGFGWVVWMGGGR
jgi:hypothetical protein